MMIVAHYKSKTLNGCEEFGDSKVCEELHIGSVCSLKDNGMA